MSEDHILLNPYAKTENHKRNVRTLAENAKGKKMTRKVDTWEYESLADCLRVFNVNIFELLTLQFLM